MKAARNGTSEFADHLKDCEDCRTELAVTRFLGTGLPTEYDIPSPDTIERFAATALITDTTTGRTSRAGRMAFDSWKERAVANVRDLPAGLVRRICLRAGSITFEIVAERQRGEWEFVGRVYEGDEPRAGFVLNAGRKKLLPKAGGFFYWSSKTAPRRLTLVSGTTNLEFDSLAW